MGSSIDRFGCAFIWEKIQISARIEEVSVHSLKSGRSNKLPIYTIMLRRRRSLAGISGTEQIGSQNELIKRQKGDAEKAQKETMAKLKMVKSVVCVCERESEGGGVK